MTKWFWLIQAVILITKASDDVVSQDFGFRVHVKDNICSGDTLRKCHQLLTGSRDPVMALGMS